MLWAERKANLLYVVKSLLVEWKLCRSIRCRHGKNLLNFGVDSTERWQWHWLLYSFCTLVKIAFTFVR